MTMRVELLGGPHDGLEININDAHPWLRVMPNGTLLESIELDDPRVVSLEDVDPEISCYHRSGQRPFFGRWRYHYHGPA